MHRILVTGASTWVGGRLVRSLESRPDTVVFAVDEIEPSIPFRSDFHLSSLDVLEFADHVISVRPTTVVHLQTLDRTVLFGPDHSQSSVILGAQALFGAIGRLSDVRTVIVKSDTAVYGSGPRSPSVVREDTAPPPRLTRYERSLRDVEAAVSQLGSEHPDVIFTVLRFNPIIGATISNPISTYLRLPVVPTLLGSDPRLQFVHEEDAVRAVEHAIDHPTEGTFNIGGDGQLYLSRILRLGKRINQRLPARQLVGAMKLLRPFGASLPEHLINLIKYGRVADTRRMQQILGFQPRLNCRRMVLAAYGRLPDPVDG
jgi:UDP-glucose 4-epimerase